MLNIQLRAIRRPYVFKILKKKTKNTHKKNKTKKKKKQKKKNAGAYGMPCDYPSLTGLIRDRKSMDPVLALTGHHGPRATYKQIVRTFEIRWGSNDCLRSVCLRLFPNPHSIITDPYGIRTCPYGSRLCTVRNP